MKQNSLIRKTKNVLLNFSVTLLIFSAPSLLYAQKVKWENDTIYKDDKPYALLIKGEGWTPVFSIRTLTNIEIAIANSDESVGEKDIAYYRVTFTVSNQYAHFASGLPLGKRLAKAIVESDVVGDSGVNPQGEKRFITIYPPKTPPAGNIIINVGTATSYDMAERNRSTMIFVNNGTIRQDNVVIGSCSSSTTTNYGKIYTTISFSLPDGTKCAEATFEGYESNTCSLVTMKDNRTHSIAIKNAAMQEEEIAEYLVKNYYM